MHIQLFNFRNNPVRSFIENDEIWFLAKDVCDVLGYANNRDAVKTHCKEAGVAIRYVRSGGQSREVTFINEPNMYRLVMRSRMKAAELFEDWVVSEVLPTLRKTGRYEIPNYASRFRERQMLNVGRVERGYFSVMEKVDRHIVFELEKAGCQVDIHVDISVGIMFANFLRRKGIDPDAVSKPYKHLYPDGREVDARQYKLSVESECSEFIVRDYIPNFLLQYSHDRQPEHDAALIKTFNLTPLPAPKKKQAIELDKRKALS